jgi:hypothetical protein
MISLDTLRAVPIPPELRVKMVEYAVEVADSAARGSRSAAGA